MEDVQRILDLAARARRYARDGVQDRRHRHLHLGVNILVPKPYTPWQRYPMDPRRASRRRSRCSRRASRGCRTSRMGRSRSARRSGRPTSQGRQRRRRRSRPPPAANRSPPCSAASPSASTPRSSSRRGRPPLALHAAGVGLSGTSGAPCRTSSGRSRELPLPWTRTASAMPITRRWYSYPSPFCLPNQFMKKPFGGGP